MPKPELSLSELAGELWNLAHEADIDIYKAEALHSLQVKIDEARLDELETASKVREFTHHPYIKDRIKQLKKEVK